MMKIRHPGRDSRQASCLAPFGLMQICSGQICAGNHPEAMDGNSRTC
ncbi:MAG: hypothetical protein Q7U66_08040 [Methylobacter sp.]|nr:hypothetical protein [Methylobacter sp.]